ncbi:MAG TPA: TadE/TadG family type IV pilus assembly protein [Aurantimonas sp.]|jgi:Flp pilus assembly protein TadG|nr:TadE/TadG family type IV pilus assembly protein [Aurantimonas sp.]
MRKPFRLRFPPPRRLAQFAGQRQGVGAVEFALIAPVALLLYFGWFEGTQAFQVVQRVESTAETIGNLVARTKTMNDVAINNIFDISTAIMTPFPADSLKMMITAVAVDVDGKGLIHWSKANAGSALTPGQPYDVPQELVFGAKTYLIVADVTYDYKPIFGFGGWFDGISVEKSYTFRPRLSKEIVWEN